MKCARRPHDRNNLVYCVSCRMLARSARNVALPRSSSVAVKARFPVSATSGSSIASTRWLSVCPRESAARPMISSSTSPRGRTHAWWVRADAVRGADQTDRDRIDDCTVAMRNHLIETFAIPCPARDLDERASLREVSSWRSREGTKAAASSAISRKPRRQRMTPRGAHARETRRRKIPAHPSASRPASPVSLPHRGYRRPPPPTRCRWNRRRRRPETTATARSSADKAPPPRFGSSRSDPRPAAVYLWS